VTFGSLRAYRYVRYRAPYPPDAPYNDAHGRFNDGIRFLLYVADDPSSATAEFYRRNPEFLLDRTIPSIELYELDLLISGRCLDVRTSAQAAAVGVPFDRLRSNDTDEDARYVECRALADAAEQLGCGIAYPSAASTSTAAWCLALFGRPSASTWSCLGYSEQPLPVLTAAQVRVLPA